MNVTPIIRRPGHITPTLSEWSLTVLAALLLAFALPWLRPTRRRP